jgi:hypothetical protein
VRYARWTQGRTLEQERGDANAKSQRVRLKFAPQNNLC